MEAKAADTEPAGGGNEAESPVRPLALRATRRWADSSALRMAAYVVVVLAGGWWMLGELRGVLRPLMLAVFLGYVLLPYYSRLRLRLPAAVAVILMAGATTAVLMGLVTAVYSSLIGLAQEEPELKARALKLMRTGSGYLDDYAPGLLPGPIGDGNSQEAKDPEEVIVQQITGAVVWAADLAAFSLLEAGTTGLYLLFLLLESGRFPQRVRAAYPPDRADHVLKVFGRINAAIISYLKAKVLSSLVLAVPVGLVLVTCGVKFALLWAVLTFVCNFIPYVGSVVAYSLPVGFAFLQMDIGVWPVIVASLLLACHVGSASIAEPLILGRIVGLSPLVILAALSVWGLLWGLPGMFLAVPLTVVVVIVLDNLEVTRPLARLLGGDVK